MMLFSSITICTNNRKLYTYDKLIARQWLWQDRSATTINIIVNVTGCH